MNLRTIQKKISGNLVGFSLQVILMLAIVGSSWAASQIKHTVSRQTASVTEQLVDVNFSLYCIPSTSLTDFLFDASLESPLFLAFSIDFSSREVSNCIAFFVNAYARNPFYTFVSTQAP